MVPATIPVLPATNIERGAQFYGRLGFIEDGRAADYLSLVHPLGIEVHLHLEGRWGIRGSAHSGAAYIRFDTAAEARLLHDAWAGADPDRSVSDLHDTPYGLIEFMVVDPFGNTISVGGPSSPWGRRCSAIPDNDRANSEQTHNVWAIVLATSTCQTQPTPPAESPLHRRVFDA